MKDPGISDLRVVYRVNNEKGHYVDPMTVRANFYGNLEKLDQYYPVADSLKVIDTSTSDHILLAHIEKHNVIEATDLAELPLWFSESLPNIIQLLQQLKDINL